MLACEVRSDGSVEVRAAVTPLYEQYRKSARSRRKKWRLGPDLFHEITKRPCHYCGALPAREASGVGKRRRRLDGLRNGVDRVDNDRGYEPDNVVACCWPCNAAKSTHPAETFLAHCARLVEAGQRSEEDCDIEGDRCSLCFALLHLDREGPRYCLLCETFAFRDRRQIPSAEVYELARLVSAHCGSETGAKVL